MYQQNVDEFQFWHYDFCVVRCNVWHADQLATARPGFEAPALTM